jgi:glycosyltransferase involved in cell wall biosynthesis
MKILICTWSLTHGGAERVASLWARGFVEHGHSVDFLLGSHSRPITYNIPPNSKVYYECPIKDALSVRFIPQWIKIFLIKRIIKKVTPDVIICVMPNWGPIIRKATKGMQKIPIIITEHNSYERPFDSPMSSKMYEQKFSTNASYNAVTVLTESDKTFLKNKMGTDFVKNTYVLPNPLSFDPVDKTPQKQKIILAAGRLEVWHYKGFDILIKAWGKISKKYPDWILNIAGAGNQKSLKELAIQSNVDKQIHFLGFVEMLPEYRKSSIFVLSSRYEGFGMVLTEAMSQGCACIACDYKGRQREIIENDSQGIICPPENIDALADAIEKMIINEDYRNKCSINAIERSHYYSVKNITTKWEKIFENLKIRS